MPKWQPDSPCVIVVTGPTATGKTSLAVELAQALESRVISADSRLVYRGLDIGTAKPTEAEKQGIPHALIDVAGPTETFTVADYVRLATPMVESALAEGRYSIVAGGTGFYLKALLQKEILPPIPPDPAVRAQLQADLEADGVATLYARLQTVDPLRAAQLYPQDAARIMRALEIIETTGQPVPQLPQNQPPQLKYPTVFLGLTFADRARHRQLIADRVDAMLAAGWLDEVTQLMRQFGPQAHALQATHGYPELVDVVEGRAALAEARQSVIHQVCQYARRQRTWFKRHPLIDWYAVDEYSSETRLSWALNAIVNHKHPPLAIR